jgi:hypothetical protein
MTYRLNVIEEVRLSFEVPYISDRGESFDCLNVIINERRQGVDISYAILESSRQDLDILFPDQGVDMLALTTKSTLHELGVRPQRLILQLWESCFNGKNPTVEGRAPVDKNRDTVLFMLTKTPFVYKFGYDLLLWHQSLHAQDRWQHRFPAAHPLVHAGEWLDALWHFSIDGRLEKWGKPHYTREERLAEAVSVFQRLEGLTSSCPNDLAVRLCDDLWGREVTMTELLAIAGQTGLAGH